MQAFQRKRISEKTYNLNFFFDKIVLLRCWLFLCGLIAQKIRNENWHIFYVVVFIYIGVKKIFLYLTRLYFSQLLYQSWLSLLLHYKTVSYEILRLILIGTRFIYNHYQNDKYNARKRIRTKSPWVNIILSSFSLVTSGLSTTKGILLLPHIEKSSKTVVKYCTAWYLEQKPTKIKDLIHNVI